MSQATQTTQASDDASAFDDGFDVTAFEADDMSEPDGQVGDLTAPGTAVAPVDGQPVIAQFLDMTSPLTVEEARELTEHIRSTSDVVFVLLSRAHAGKAWEALGYESWASYVGTEFDISRSRSYQLLNQASVIEAIEGAVPDGTDFTISEAAARDLRSIIGDIVPEIQAATYDLPPTEAGEVVEEMVDRYREEIRDRKTAKDEEAAADQYERAPHSPGNGTWTPPPVDEDDMADSMQVRRNFQAVYDLYSSVSALKGMPGIQDVINTIPPERRIQVNANVPVALAWLQEFSNAWFAEDFQTESVADDEGDDGEYDDDSI